MAAGPRRAGRGDHARLVDPAPHGRTDQTGVFRERDRPPRTVGERDRTPRSWRTLGKTPRLGPVDRRRIGFGGPAPGGPVDLS